MTSGTNRDDYLLMSGIQHFCFCRRQWALIHIEQCWAENYRTVEGALIHSRAHDPFDFKVMNGTLVFRAVNVVCDRLRLTGVCDVVEYIKDAKGISLPGVNGLYLPLPIEYKRGKAKAVDCDRVQVCAQVMALEEMLSCSIDHGCIFYAETHRREYIEIDKSLRLETENLASEMWKLYEKKLTPQVEEKKHCRACSLNEMCIGLNHNANEYYKHMLEEVL